jgi:hypothetical protein
LRRGRRSKVKEKEKNMREEKNNDKNPIIK